MIQVKHDVIIRCPREEVFAYVTHLENLPQWQSGVAEAKRIGTGVTGVGTEMAIARQFIGHRIEGTLVVTDFEPNKMLSIETTSGPMQVRMMLSFEAVGGDTRLSVVGEVDPKGFLKIAEPLAAQEFKRELESSLGKLKVTLESAVRSNT